MKSAKTTDLMDRKNTKDPLISVVVCAYSSKRFNMTIGCINSIFNNTYRNYEIILVIDGNAELRQKLEDKFKEIDNMTITGHEKDQGPSVTRNRGIMHVKGDIIAFIDDDAIAAPDWLEHIAENFTQHPDILVVGGKLLPVYENGSRKLPEEILWIVGSTYKGHPENKQFIRNVISANMAVKKNVFNGINFETLYDKSEKGLLCPIKQLEDTIFCIRVNGKKPYSVLYDPEVIVHHNVTKDRLSLNYIFNRTFSEGILKARIRNIDTNKVLSYEHNYLNTILISIIKNLYTFKIRDALLLSLTVSGVALGYIGYLLQEKIFWRQRKYQNNNNGYQNNNNKVIDNELNIAE